MISLELYYVQFQRDHQCSWNSFQGYYVIIFVNIDMYAKITILGPTVLELQQNN